MPTFRKSEHILQGREIKFLDSTVNICPCFSQVYYYYYFVRGPSAVKLELQLIITTHQTSLFVITKREHVS